MIDVDKKLHQLNDRLTYIKDIFGGKQNEAARLLQGLGDRAGDRQRTATRLPFLDLRVGRPAGEVLGKFQALHAVEVIP